MKRKKTYQYLIATIVFYIIFISPFPANSRAVLDQAEKWKDPAVHEMIQKNITDIESGDTDKLKSIFSDKLPNSQDYFDQFTSDMQYVDLSSYQMAGLDSTVSILSDGRQEGEYSYAYEYPLAHPEYPEYHFVLIHALVDVTGDEITLRRIFSDVHKVSIVADVDFELVRDLPVMLASLLLNLFILITLMYAIRKTNLSWWMLIGIIILNLHVQIGSDKFGISFGVYPILSSGLWGAMLMTVPIPFGALLFWWNKMKGKYSE